MIDTEQTIEEQVPEETEGTPGARAPGDGDAPAVGTPGAGVGGAGAAGSNEAAQSPEVPGAASLGESEDGVPGALQDDEDIAEIEGDLDELAVLATERDEYLALAQRTQADFENYRKRVARESALALQRGVAKLAKELLPALDNLDRALEAAATDDPLLDGVRLVRAELSAGLGRLGIESFGAAGDTFDPVEHEAVAQQPVEGAPSGSVVEVYQPGYRLGASVIRPARVLVAA
jgi:molecular chaperone GrpE